MTFHNLLKNTEINKICRGCLLTSDDDMTDLIQNTDFEQQCPSYREMIASCTAIEVGTERIQNLFK